jgi:hypothetical protein
LVHESRELPREHIQKVFGGAKWRAIVAETECSGLRHSAMDLKIPADVVPMFRRYNEIEADQVPQVDLEL